MIELIKNFKIDEKMTKRICMFFAFVCVLMTNQEAFATNSPDAISQVLCNVVTQLQGGIGKGIATIAIIVLGIGLFLGKLSWPLAIATALGIGLIFGAAGIVGWISSGANSANDTTGSGTAQLCGGTTTTPAKAGS